MRLEEVFVGFDPERSDPYDVAIVVVQTCIAMAESYAKEQEQEQMRKYGDTDFVHNLQSYVEIAEDLISNVKDNLDSLLLSDIADLVRAHYPKLPME